MKGGLPVALLALVGCATTPAALRWDAADGDYLDLVEHWTRTDRVYRVVENIATFTATLESPALRTARLKKFGPDFIPGSIEAGRSGLSTVGEEVEFVIAMTSARRRQNDLADNDSTWRVALQSDSGERMDATRVEKVKVIGNVRAVYPHVNEFARVYRARFPAQFPSGASVRAGVVRLRIASAWGVGELDWALSP